MKLNKKILALLLIFLGTAAFAGTGDAYGAKPIFDKIDAALNDTYLSGLIALGFAWRALGAYKDSGNDWQKALAAGWPGIAVGSLGGIALGISGATI